MYPDPDALDPTAAALSYRMPRSAEGFVADPTGTPRATVAGRDRYLTMQLTLGFNLATRQQMGFDPKHDLFRTPPPPKHARALLPGGLWGA